MTIFRCWCHFTLYTLNIYKLRQRICPILRDTLVEGMTSDNRAGLRLLPLVGETMQKGCQSQGRILSPWKLGDLKLSE